MTQKEIIQKLKIDRSNLESQIKQVEETLREKPLLSYSEKYALETKWWKLHGALSYNLQMETYIMSDGCICKEYTI